MASKTWNVSLELFEENKSTPIRMTMVYDRTFSHFHGQVPHPFYVIIGGLETIEAAVIFGYKNVKVMEDGSLVLAYAEVTENAIEKYRKTHPSQENE